MEVDWSKAPEGYDFFVIDKGPAPRSRSYFAKAKVVRGKLRYEAKDGTFFKASAEIEVHERPGS